MISYILYNTRYKINKQGVTQNLSKDQAQPVLTMLRRINRLLRRRQPTDTSTEEDSILSTSNLLLLSLKTANTKMAQKTSKRLQTLLSKPSSTQVSDLIIQNMMSSWRYLLKLQDEPFANANEHLTSTLSLIETSLISTFVLATNTNIGTTSNSNSRKKIINKLLNNSYTKHSIITHVKNVLTPNFLPSSPSSPAAGIQCIYLLINASTVKRKRIKHILISNNIIELLISSMASLQIDINNHNNDNNDNNNNNNTNTNNNDSNNNNNTNNTNNTNTNNTNTNINNKINQETISKASVRLLLSINVLHESSEWNKLLIESLTTIILSGLLNIEFAVSGLLNVASSITSYQSRSSKININKVWSTCILRLIPFYSTNIYNSSWFTLLLCKLGHIHEIKILVTKTKIKYLLRSIVLNASYLPSQSITSTTSISKSNFNQIHIQQSAGCALSILGDNMSPTTKLYYKSSKKGIKILCMDGGGTRGLATIESLRAISQKCNNKPIHELFDIICGTSTGGILAVVLGILKRPLDEVEEMYKKFAVKVFNKSTNLYKGMNTLVTGSMYSSEPLELLLKDYGRDNGKYTMGEYGHYRHQLWNITKEEEELLANHNHNNNSNRNQSECRVFVVASAIGTVSKPIPYLFRNYNYNEKGPISRHPGTTNVPLWSALRATTSALGYFTEHRIGDEIYSDGAVVANNPTGIAIHEASCLYPNQYIESVVSLGTGRFNTAGVAAATTAAATAAAAATNSYSNSNDLLIPMVPTQSKGILATTAMMIIAATDTEIIHHVVEDLLFAKKETTYIRINPYINPVALNESRMFVLVKMQEEFKEWLNSKDGELMLLKTRNGLIKEESGRRDWSMKGVGSAVNMAVQVSRL